MEIYYQYVKLRRKFGRHPRFVDDGAEMIADIRPNEEHANEYIDKNPCTTTAQVVPQMSEHEANTNAVIYVQKAMSHVEGGWPKDVDYTEAEHTERFRKKVEKDEEYVRAITNLCSSTEELVKQNNAIDIYEEYFTGEARDHSAETPTAKTLTVLKDPAEIPRCANYSCWHPDGGKIAVSYAIMDFQQQPEDMPLSSYVWDITNPNEPEYELAAQSQVCCARFNTKNYDVIGAGQYNGQFAFFDMRKGKGAVDASPIENSHRDPVYDFAWLQSKTGMEAMSVSSDGYVLWWDIRKLTESLENLPLKEKNSEVILGGVSMEYDPQAGATKFMIGTESGSILSCNRKAKNPTDRVGTCFQGHHGPVYGLKRNPFNSKYFLSVGDWTARIWMDDNQLKTPLMSTKYHPAYLTGGTWSPTRIGVYFTTRMDGVLDVWDLYYKHSAPTLQVQVTDTDTRLDSLSLSDSGKHVAVGDARGSTTLLELCDGLVEMGPNEKSVINLMFDRETSREKNLEKAIKEARVKARKEAAKNDGPLDNVTDEALATLEADFLKMTELEQQS